LPGGERSGEHLFFSYQGCDLENRRGERRRGLTVKSALGGAQTYGVAVLSVAVALALRLLLTPHLADHHPYSLFLAAVVFVIWYGGTGPALLALVLGYLCADWFFIPPFGAFTVTGIDDRVGTGIYVIAGLVVVLFGRAMHTAQTQARRSAAEAVSERRRLEREVVERHRAEAALRESHGRVASILESISDAFYAFDREWRFTYLNGQAERYFGRAKESLLGQSVWETLPEKLNSTFEFEFRRAVSEQTSVHFETQSPLTGRWVEVNAYPSAEGLSVYFRDISERKSAHAELVNRSRQQQAIAELSQRALTCVSTPALLDRAAALVAETLGMEYAKVLELLPDGEDFLLRAGVGWKEGLVGHARVTADLRSQAGYTLFASEPVVAGDLVSYEVIIAEDIMSEARFRPPKLLLDHGVVSGMSVIIPGEPSPFGVLGVHTARRRSFSPDDARFLQAVANVLAAAVQRRSAEEALRAREAQFRQITEGMPQIVWVAAPDGSVIHYNQRWFDFTGMTADQSYAPDGWRAIVHPDEVERCYEAWYACVRTGQLFEVECRYHDRLTGGYRWHLVRALPVRNETGAIVQWFGTCTDIDDQKRAAEALEASDRHKDEFLAMLAHELRNPLAPIYNAVEILKRREDVAHAIDWERDVIDRHVRHMTRLIDDLLDLSRISQGKITLEKRPLDLAAVVEQAVETVRPLVEARKHRLEIELPSDPVRFQADSTRLTQVLGNVLANAAKYTEEGGFIQLKAEKEEGQLVIRILDNGIGIAPESLPQVFEAFAQIDKSIDRSQGGLGVGLTLARRLVEMHGGTIDVFSGGLGQGSEVVIRLPTPNSAQSEEAPARAARPGPASIHRILVVDDSELLAQSLARLLSLNGHEVRVALDGVAAVREALAFRPDIAFVDIGLPGMDGLSVARRLREEPGLRGTMLVALTGYGEQSDRLRSRQAGFDYHLVKPLDMEVLNALLNERSVKAEMLSA